MELRNNSLKPCVVRAAKGRINCSRPRRNFSQSDVKAELSAVKRSFHGEDSAVFRKAENAAVWKIQIKIRSD